jgi:hypothetical protein
MNQIPEVQEYKITLQRWKIKTLVSIGKLTKIHQIL